MILSYLPPPFSNYSTLAIIADCCSTQPARFPVITNYLTGMISLYLPPSFSNYPTLTIIADCCHAQAVRYPIIVNHLTGMISPYLPPSFSNYPTLTIIADCCHVPNSQIPSDRKLSNWPDSTNSILSYKYWDILAPFITLCFSHKIVLFLSVLIRFKKPDSP